MKLSVGKAIWIFLLAVLSSFGVLNGDIQASAVALGKSNTSTKKCGTDGKACEIVPHQDVLASDKDSASAKKDTSSSDVKSSADDFRITVKNRPSRTDSDGDEPPVDWNVDMQRPNSPAEIESLMSLPRHKEKKQLQENSDDQSYQETDEDYDPHSPLVRCSFLPIEFLECQEPTDLQGNQTAYEELGYGCYKYGGQRWEDVQNTSVHCTVLPGIDCYGLRTFRRDGFPCVRFTGHYFLSTLLFSVLMGFLGLDRFCLGHTCLAVGKLMTLGGLGVWWLVDIVLLITGHLLPEDGSNWMPNY